MTTPMIRQYLDIKSKHPDCILFFRLGDFYEMFFEDAIKASEVLSITLTKRGKGDGHIPMCGVPFHAVDSYLYKLTLAGLKVAICEQTSSPDGKGIVQREVVKIVTPGTTFDEKVLDLKTNNYICSIYPTKSNFGVSYLDISTGEFALLEIKDYPNLLAFINKLRPSECIFPEKFYKISNLHKDIISFGFSTIFPYESINSPHLTLINHFKVKTLDCFGLEGLIGGVNAAGTLLAYVSEMQMADLNHIISLRHDSNKTNMPLDHGTINNLEIFHTLSGDTKKGTLISIIDRTNTSMGGRMLKKWILNPLTNHKQILDRHEAVEELLGSNEAILLLLKHVYDLERLISKISIGSCNAKDLIALRDSLNQIPEIKALIKEFKSDLIINIYSGLNELTNLTDLISKAIKETPPITIREGGMFNFNYNSKLDELLLFEKESKSFLENYKNTEIEKSGINSLKIGFNKVFGFYIEITNKHKDQVPENYIRKQTLASAERYITPELKEYEEKALNNQDILKNLEYELFQELRAQILQYIKEIQQNARLIAAFDVLNCFAEISLENSYTRPNLNTKKLFKVVQGRHPVIEKLVSDMNFIANDTYMNKKDKFISLLTGPNMAGKSTYLRQNALIILMSQIGCFVPAQEADICIFDRIFTRIGASDNLSKGQSTFMVEMQETANILNNATENSFIILDEIGRGTSTYDGVSIAWALLEHLNNNVKAMTMFATHYHELIHVVDDLEYCDNYCVGASEEDGEVIFHYHVQKGAINRSFGIEVGSLAGLPNTLINRAKEILLDFENSHQISLDIAPEKPFQEKKQKQTINQMGLFDNDAKIDRKQQKIVDRLKEVDINNLTPLQAIQTLNELKKEL